MATTTTTHCKMGIVDASGNVNVLYPQTTGADVSITPNSAAASATTVQALVNALTASAFIQNFTGIDDTSTSSTVKTWSANKINSEISALNSNITNLNSSLNWKTAWTGSTTLPTAGEVYPDANLISVPLIINSKEVVLVFDTGDAGYSSNYHYYSFPSGVTELGKTEMNIGANGTDFRTYLFSSVNINIGKVGASYRTRSWSFTKKIINVYYR